MPTATPIPRINVLQHGELGKRMIEWALDPESRPKTLEEFKAQTNGIIEQPFPPWVKALQFVQSNLDTLLIRLPAPEMVQQSLDRTATATGKYPLPDFYEEHIVHGQHSQREMLEYRVGDYTMAQCQ
jgi:hypothetical protein